MGRTAAASPGAGLGFPGVALIGPGGRPRGSHVKPGAPLGGAGYAWPAQYRASGAGGWPEPGEMLEPIGVLPVHQSLVIFSTWPRGNERRTS